MKTPSRRVFLEGVGATAVLGLVPASPAVAGSDAAAAAVPLAEALLQGLADYIDVQAGPAALLDGEFRVVRTSRPHQVLLNYDPADVYGKSCEAYWSPEMHRVVRGIGGLPSFRRLGVYCMDFTLVRQLPGGRTGQGHTLVSVGRTVAIGDPHQPFAYLTTSRLADHSTAVRSGATLLCLKEPDTGL